MPYHEDYNPNDDYYQPDAVRKTNATPNYAGKVTPTVYAISNPYDLSRHKTTNGFDVYNDNDHPEIAMPITSSAVEAAAAESAGFIMMDQARRAANARKPASPPILLAAHLTDGTRFWGGHLNVLTSEACWQRVFVESPLNLAMLATWQVATQLLITGAGMVYAPDNAHAVYCMSQRAEATNVLVGVSTMWPNRSWLNTRDEPLCGNCSHLARVHTICSDTVLLQVPQVLRYAMQQLFWAALEDGYLQPDTILVDPLQALRQYNRDISLRERARLSDGSEVTLLELNRRIFDGLANYAASAGGELAAAIPGLGEHLSRWDGMLSSFEAHDWDALARTNQWVCKYLYLQEVMGDQLLTHWKEAQMEDHLFASLDPSSGIAFAMQRAGMLEQVIDDALIADLLSGPPVGSRSYTYGQLLSVFGPQHVESFDWDYITVRFRSNGAVQRYTFHLDDPRRFSRAETQHLFEPQPVAIDRLLNELGARPGLHTIYAAPKGAVAASAAPQPAEGRYIAKYLGADIELSAFLLPGDGHATSCWVRQELPVNRLIREIDGISGSSYAPISYSTSMWPYTSNIAGGGKSPARAATSTPHTDQAP